MNTQKPEVHVKKTCNDDEPLKKDEKKPEQSIVGKKVPPSNREKSVKDSPHK